MTRTAVTITDDNKRIIAPQLFIAATSLAGLTIGFVSYRATTLIPNSELPTILIVLIAGLLATFTVATGWGATRMTASINNAAPTIKYAGNHNPITPTLDAGIEAASINTQGLPNLVARVVQVLTDDPVMLDMHSIHEDTNNNVNTFTLIAEKPGAFTDAKLTDRLVTKVLGSIPNGKRQWQGTIQAEQDALIFAKKVPFPPVLFPSIPSDSDLAYTPAQAYQRYLKDPKLAIGEDAFGNRLSINFPRQPHGLVVGGTGSGKSVYNRGTIEDLRRRGWMISIVDGKNVDYTSMLTTPNVVMVSQDVASWVRHIKWMNDHVNYRYSYAKDRQKRGILPVSDLPPLYFLIDEFASVAREIEGDVRFGKKTLTMVYNWLKNIAAKARQARLHLVISTQEIYAETLPGDLLSNLKFAIALGQADGNTLQNAFGNDTRPTARRISDSIDADKDRGRGIIEVRDEKTGKTVAEFQSYFSYSPGDPDMAEDLEANPEGDFQQRWLEYKTKVSDRVPKLYARMWYEEKEPDEMDDITIDELLDLPMVTIEQQDPTTGQWTVIPEMRKWDTSDITHYVGGQREVNEVDAITMSSFDPSKPIATPRTEENLAHNEAATGEATGESGA